MENSQNINLQKKDLKKIKTDKTNNKRKFNNNFYLYVQIFVMVVFVVSSVMLKVKDGEAFYEVKEDYSQFFTTDIKEYSNFSYKKYIDNIAEKFTQQYNELTQTIANIYGKGANDTYPSNVSDEKYVPEDKGIMPLSGIITSNFGVRKNPFNSKKKDFHTGIDIAAAKGTFIKASFSGTVVETGYTDIAGNYIKIVVNDEVETFYGHAQFVLVRKGDKVVEGQIIATVGDTGLVTGPHLHFETLYNNNRVNPIYMVE